MFYRRGLLATVLLCEEACCPALGNEIGHEGGAGTDHKQSVGLIDRGGRVIDQGVPDALLSLV